MAAETWNEDTELPDGARSWEIDFEHSPGTGVPAVYNSPNVDEAPKVRYTWAGDATSSVVMLEGSTRTPYSFTGGSGKGLIAQTADSEPRYSEVDWAHITTETGTDPFALNATFGPQHWQSVDGWPLTLFDDGAKVHASPYYRLYDHGTCSFAMPWFAAEDDPVPGVLNNLGGAVAGDLYSGKQFSTNGSIGIAGYSATGTVGLGSIMIHPRIGQGERAPSSHVGTFPLVYSTDDSILAEGWITLQLEGTLRVGFIMYEGIACGGRVDLFTDTHLATFPSERFPSRIRIGYRTKYREYEQGGGTCTAITEVLEGLLGSPIEDKVRSMINSIIDTELLRAQAKGEFAINSSVTPLLPSVNELQHWMLDTCDPGSPCARRTIAGTPRDGRFDMQEWLRALRHSTPPPLHSIQADEDSGPWVTDPHPVIHGDTRVDESYQGCLSEDLRAKQSVCEDLLEEYRQLGLDALVWLDKFPEDEEPEGVREQIQKFIRLFGRIQSDNLECRPMNYGINMSTVSDPTELWSCNNGAGEADDSNDPTCELVFNSPRYELPGSPPTGMHCQRRTERELPRATAQQCAALEYACFGGPGHEPPPTVDYKCLDYFLYCGSKSDYCSTNTATSRVAAACWDNSQAPRCIEREAYCTPAAFCDWTGSAWDYCDHQVFDDDLPSGGLPVEGFRSDHSVGKKVCSELGSRCSCGTVGPEQIPDHRCALRLPVEDVNITPHGAEVVMTYSDRTNGYTWLAMLDEFISDLGGDDAEFGLCDDARGGWTGAGRLPVSVLLQTGW